MQDSPIHTSLHAHTVKPEVIRFIATKRAVELAILCQIDKKDKMTDRLNKHIKQKQNTIRR